MDEEPAAIDPPTYGGAHGSRTPGVASTVEDWVPALIERGERRWSMRVMCVWLAAWRRTSGQPFLRTLCRASPTPDGGRREATFLQDNLFASRIGEITNHYANCPRRGTYRGQIVNRVHRKRMTALQRGGSRSPLYDLWSGEVFYRITRFIEAQGFSPG